MDNQRSPKRGGRLPVWLFLLGALGAMVGFSAHQGDYLAAAALGVTTLGGVWGYFAGGVRLLGVLGAFLFVFQFTIPLAHWLAPYLATEFSTAPGTTWLLSILLAALLILSGASLVIEVVSRLTTRNHPRLAAGNQLLGFGIGSAEGGLFALILLGGIVSVAPLAEHRPKIPPSGWQARFSQQLADRIVEIAAMTEFSAVAPLVANYNPFETMPELKRVQRTVAVINDPQKLTGLARHPSMMKLYEKPSVRAAMETLADDPQLRQLAAEGKSLDAKAIYSLLNNPNILRLFEQPELMRDIAHAIGELDQPIVESLSPSRSNLR